MDSSAIYKRGIRMVKQIETVDQVLECIENKNSFVVTGGAGSVKT